MKIVQFTLVPVVEHVKTDGLVEWHMRWWHHMLILRIKSLTLHSLCTRPPRTTSKKEAHTNKSCSDIYLNDGAGRKRNEFLKKLFDDFYVSYWRKLYFFPSINTRELEQTEQTPNQYYNLILTRNFLFELFFKRNTRFNNKLYNLIPLGEINHRKKDSTTRFWWKF